MEGKKLLHSIRLKNFLSYGDQGEEIKLEPLNVLIGRNASGKSNLIEAINLLRATPRDLAGAIREGGGVDDYIWKGCDESAILNSELEVIVDYSQFNTNLKHKIIFTSVSQRLELVEEMIEDASVTDVLGTLIYQNIKGSVTIGAPVINAKKSNARKKVERSLSTTDISREQSILVQIKDKYTYPEVTYLGNIFDKIQLYRDLNLKRGSLSKFPQKADLPDDFLLEDGSNLGLVLDDLIDQNGAIDKIMVELKKFYAEADIIRPKIRGNTVQLFIHEKGLAQPIPATRMSDGTLRYLCLLTILCHPEPPPLICIEEPELGLHPDVLPDLAKLLIEASQRTQLIITTHSQALVSGLSEVPESVVVCERNNEGTHLRRLEPKKLKKWLEKYSLGDLWEMGEIGGN